MTPPFKPFSEMTADDYAAVGLRCGLEVHQQLLTHRKLFCRCPAGQYSDAYDAEVLRHMRPTLSELGEYDGTALMEKKTRKNIHYRIHHKTVCTYDIDDTPPFFPDERAIDIALEIAMLNNLNIVGEIHIARKQYLDGSIPAGFQRTAILGVEGSIPYNGRNIGIRQLSIEEDSCREVSDRGHERVLLTDRLGMPLIEVVTEPDMNTPDEMAEVCEVIRRLCRSTGKVRTGYGAARQDVNVSVTGGTRIEIKGVPQITRIPLLVYNEAMRQCSLLRIRVLLHERGVTPETFQASTHDVTSAVIKTRYQPIRRVQKLGHCVKCVVLEGFAGLLNHPTQEHTTFAKELSDRVRVIACLMTLPNIVHSDTASELLTVRDWKVLRRRTKAEDRDALVVVWGGEDDTRTACEELVIRAKEATQGIPPETRQANKDGTNGFERILPGAERMYPDTDLPPMAITADRLDRIRAGLPERVWDRLSRYQKMCLPADVIVPLCISPRADLFDRLVDELDVDPTFAAVVLIQRFRGWLRAGLNPAMLADDDIFMVFRAFTERRISRSGVCIVLTRMLPSGADDDPAALSAHDALDSIGGPLLNTGQLGEQLIAAVHHAEGLSFPAPDRKRRFLMGGLMSELTGRADGRELAQLVDQSPAMTNA